MEVKNENIGPPGGGFSRIPLPKHGDAWGLTENHQQNGIYLKPAREGLGQMNKGWFVCFDPFVTAFTDDYTTNWTSTDVYGRMDPIFVYQNTQRVINISFNVVAYDYYEANYNMKQMRYLAQMLYPVYRGSGARRYISSPPLFGMKWNNFVRGPGDSMLMGVLSGFTFNPVLEEGMLYLQGNGSGASKGEYVPKAVAVSLEFKPIHRQKLGFDEKKGTGKDSWGGNKGFPYHKNGAHPGSNRELTNKNVGATLIKDTRTQKISAPTVVEDVNNAWGNTKQEILQAQQDNILGVGQFADGVNLAHEVSTETPSFHIPLPEDGESGSD